MDKRNFKQNDDGLFLEGREAMIACYREFDAVLPETGERGEFLGMRVHVHRDFWDTCVPYYKTPSGIYFALYIEPTYRFGQPIPGAIWGEVRQYQVFDPEKWREDNPDDFFRSPEDFMRSGMRW